MIKLITYNVENQSADDNKPDELFNFVQLRKFDFIFIGLQEVANDSSWTALIKRRFGEHNYVLVKMRNIWATWLYALVKRSRLLLLDNIESEVTAFGLGGVMGNKGGVSIRFKYHGISLVVVNGHFTPHEEGFKDRLNDYLDILTSQSFRDPDVNNILDHDLVFWMGDLNFRIEGLSKRHIEDYIEDKRYLALLEHDQLTKAIEYHNIFQDFYEGPINFPPTFKFDGNSNTYDTSKKQRKPAWTDRILYMFHTDDKFSKLSIDLLKYYSEQHIRGSDHRPVCGEFKVSFNTAATPSSVLPIQFDDITVWTAATDQVVSYRSIEKIIDNGEEIDGPYPAYFKPDRWDWIALLPSNWTLLTEDLLTYVYVSSTSLQGLGHQVSVEFHRKYLQSIAPESSLQLVYFSKQKNCIQGISNVFSFV